MSIIALLLILCLLGLAAWLVTTKLPLAPWIKHLINAVILIIAVLICLSAFGVWDELRGAKVPRL